MWLQKVLELRFEISIVALVPRANNLKETEVLNRILRAGGNGFTYKADARHAELIVDDLSQQKANAWSSPGNRSATRR